MRSIDDDLIEGTSVIGRPWARKAPNETGERMQISADGHVLLSPSHLST